MKEGMNRGEGEPVVSEQKSFGIGGYGAKVMAEQDAQQFMRPDVFLRRSGLFPDPRNFRLAVRPVCAKVDAWPTPPSPMNTHFVQLTVELTGTKRHIDEWARRVTNAVAASAPAAYGSQNDRAQHLASRGLANPVAPRGVAGPLRGTGSEREEHLKETGRTPPLKEGAKAAEPAPAPKTPVPAEEGKAAGQSQPAVRTKGRFNLE